MNELIKHLDLLLRLVVTLQFSHENHLIRIPDGVNNSYSFGFAGPANLVVLQGFVERYIAGHNLFWNTQ